MRLAARCVPRSSAMVLLCVDAFSLEEEGVIGEYIIDYG